MDDLKHLAKVLKERLTSKEGFKLIHGGGLFGGKAKKSFAVWSAAEIKAVLPLRFIHHFVHQGDDYKSYYAIYAFSTKDQIESETIARLKQAASEIELGTVRYESLTYSRLELWRGKDESFAQENNTIAETLSDVPNGLFVYAEYVGDGGNATLEKPLVIYAHSNGEDYIYPVKKSTLLRSKIS